MADNTIGGGYLYNAKPFNIINPTGIDPGQSVDILKEVSENAKNRAFQASEGDKDRQAKMVDSERQRQAMSQEADKGRQHESSIRQQEMQQNDAQFQKNFEFNRKLALDAQKNAEQKRIDELSLMKIKEKQAREFLRLQADFDTHLEGFDQMGPDPTPRGWEGTSGDLGDTNLMYNTEAYRSHVEKLNELDRKKSKMEKEQGKLNILELVQKGMFSSTNTTAEGVNLGVHVTRNLQEAVAANVKVSKGIDEVLSDAIVQYEDVPVAPVKPLEWYEQLSVFPDRVARERMNARGKVKMERERAGLPTDDIDALVEEEIQKKRFAEAGVPELFDKKARRKVLVDAMVQGMGIKPGKNGLEDAKTVLATTFDLLEEAKKLQGDARGAKLRLAAQHVNILKEIGNPHAIDYSFYALYEQTKGAEQKGLKTAVDDNLRATTAEGEAEGVNLSLKERVGAAKKASKERQELADMVELLRFARGIQVDQKTGEGRMAPVISNWGPILGPLGAEGSVASMLSDIGMALANTDDPFQAMSVLLDDDPTNDEKAGQAAKLIKDLAPEARQLFIKSIQETYSHARIFAKQNNIDLSQVNMRGWQEELDKSRLSLEKEKETEAGVYMGQKAEERERRKKGRKDTINKFLDVQGAETDSAIDALIERR